MKKIDKIINIIQNADYISEYNITDDLQGVIEYLVDQHNKIITLKYEVKKHKEIRKELGKIVYGDNYFIS